MLEESIEQKAVWLEEEGIFLQQGVPLVMKDGVSLVADIYTPPGEGPFPVLLMRQPYGRDIASTVVYAQPPWFCRQGLIVVIQDVRGRGDSDGMFNAFVHEADDGVETIAWAAALPKSNGSVGMYGFSYQGSTQLLVAGKKPPALKAMAPHMTAFDLYSGWFYRSGLLQLASTMGWGNQMLREDAKRSASSEFYSKLEASYRDTNALNYAFPLNAVDPLTDPEASPYLRNWLNHPSYDEFWKSLNALETVKDWEDIPCFHLAGWYDFYLRGSLDGFRRASRAYPERHHLLVGPWSHIPWGDAVGGVKFGAEARVDTDRLLADWMLYWCGGKTDWKPEEKPIRYFRTGENTWFDSQTWPPAGKLVTLHLSSEGRANSRFGDGALVGASDLVCPIADRFNYDPEVPVWGPGTTPGGGAQFGPADLSVSQQGNNILVYSGAPFSSTCSIAGTPVLTLFVRSTAEDTAFVARLGRRLSSGVVEFISLGATQLHQGKCLADGVVELTIVLDDCAFSCAEGDSLILDISSSAFPLLVRHPNTTADPLSLSSAGDFQRALQTVLHDAEHKSVLYLNEDLSI